MRYYGCAGCHEIAGLEEEQRIGTELTKEGSKPIERLDFALLGHKAEAEGWYTHKGFFEHKLENPAVYDQGKEKAKQDRLKMPNFNLSKPEIDAVTTFLRRLGGCQRAGALLLYADRCSGRTSSTAGGWSASTTAWAATRSMSGRPPSSTRMTRYQDPDWKDQKPPTLIGEGARVDPDWLMRFLNNPALSETDTNRDGVRQYLKARMPTFNFSDGEIRKLVRFFEALSSQAQPFIAEQLDPLTDQERSMARAPVHERRRALPEVPYDGRREARRPRHGSEFHRRQGTPEAGLDQALDAGPGHDESGHGDAVGPVPAEDGPLGIRRPHAGQFQRLSEGSRRFAGALHVPVHAGRTGPAARRARARTNCRQHWSVHQSPRSRLLRRLSSMKKIWIGAGLAVRRCRSRCGGGGEKTEAPRQAESAPAAGGGARPTPDEANGGTVTGKVAFDGDDADHEDHRHVGQPGLHARAHKRPQKSEEVVVNDNGTLKYAFVWVKSGLPDKQLAGAHARPSRSTRTAACTSRT